MPISSGGDRPETAGQGDIDLRQLIGGLGRKKWWIIIPTLATLGLTFAAVSLIKPRYTAEAKVLLENQDSFYTRPDKEPRDQQQTLDPEAVQSQVQLVTSRDLARQVVQKLELLKSPEFDTLLKGIDPLTRVLILLGLQKDPASMAPEERVLETYFNKLTVFPVAKTRVLTVEFVATSPELAAEAANAIAELYLKAQEDAKRRSAKTAAGWLLANIEDLRTKVQQAESQVADFRARSGLLLGANNTMITNQQLAELNTQLSTARAAQSESQAKAQRLTELLRQGRVSEVSDVVKDDLIRRISEQRVTLKAQLALESRTLLPGHPRIKEMQAQLADVENEMRRASEKVGHALEGDAKVAAARLRSIEAALDAQKKVAAAGDGEDVQLRAYEREAKSSREQLESYLVKYREASARDVANAATADARIISRAVAPQLPSFPKKVPMLLIGGLGALFLSAGMVLARLLLSGKALVPAALLARGEEVAGVVPAEAAQPLATLAAVIPPPPEPAHTLVLAQGTVDPIKAADPVIAAQLPTLQATSSMLVQVPPAPPRDAGAAPVESPVVEAHAITSRSEPPATPLSGLVRVVRNLREGEAQDQSGLCILVTGPARANGATSTAISLARALAQEARVVIVDLDVAAPGLDALVAETGDLDAPAGLTDLIAGEAAFSDALHRDASSKLHVVPAGCAALAPGGHAAELTRIVRALQQAYDYVVLDAAAPVAQPQSLEFAKLARAVVIVAPDPENSADEIVALLQQLPGGETCETLIFTPPPLGRKALDAAA